MLVEYLREQIKTIFSSHKNNTEDCPQIKLSALYLSSAKIMYDNMKSLLILVSFFTTIVTLAAFAFDNSIICSLPIASRQDIFDCATPLEAISIIYIAVKLFVVSMLIRLWYNSSVNKQNITVYAICVPTMTDIKIFLAFLVFLAINILPLGSYFLLQKRVPNPNWIVESGFFAMVSIGFLIPILSVFYYVMIAFVINKQKLPPLSIINRYIFFNANKIFFSILFYVFVSVILVTFYLIKTVPNISHNVIISTICGEFIYNAIEFILILFFINYLINLQQKLFEKD